MYMLKKDLNKKKELYKEIEEALNKRNLLSSKATVCTFRSLFKEKIKQSNNSDNVNTEINVKNN